MIKVSVVIIPLSIDLFNLLEINVATCSNALFFNSDVIFSLAIKKPMLLILIWSDIFASNIYGLSAVHYLPIMAPV